MNKQRSITSDQKNADTNVRFQLQGLSGNLEKGEVVLRFYQILIVTKTKFNLKIVLVLPPKGAN